MFSSFLAVLAYTSAFCALVWMSNRTCRLKNILRGPRGLSFHFEQVPLQSMLTRLRYRRDGQTDRQTDGQTAFQLYIVDRLASVPALSCRCMHDLTYLLLHLLSLLSLLYLPSFCLASLQHLFSVLANGYSYLVF